MSRLSPDGSSQLLWRQLIVQRGQVAVRYVLERSESDDLDVLRMCPLPRYMDGA